LQPEATTSLDPEATAHPLDDEGPVLIPIDWSFLEYPSVVPVPRFIPTTARDDEDDGLDLFVHYYVDEKASDDDESEKVSFPAELWMRQLIFRSPAEFCVPRILPKSRMCAAYLNDSNPAQVVPKQEIYCIVSYNIGVEYLQSCNFTVSHRCRVLSTITI